MIKLASDNGADWLMQAVPSEHHAEILRIAADGWRTAPQSVSVMGTPHGTFENWFAAEANAESRFFRGVHALRSRQPQSAGS